MKNFKYRLLIESPENGKYTLDVFGPNMGVAIKEAKIKGFFKDKEDSYYISHIDVVEM